VSTRPTPPEDYRFASDNTAGLCPEALAGVAEANPGRSGSYGDDPLTAEAQARISDLFETKCEVFFVFNGTAANALALSSLCQRYQSIFCLAEAHVEIGECAAPEFFTGGSKVIPVRGHGGKLRPAELELALGQGRGAHFPQPGAVTLAQASDWGTVYQPAEIQAVAQFAHARGMGVHIDGARFANAWAAARNHGGASPADLTWRSGVDVLSLGGTKNGMLAAEAVVFFRPELAKAFAYRSKQSGQVNSKMRFASAQWNAVLREGAWLRHAAQANRMAALLAEGVRALPGLGLSLPVETNMVFVELSAAAAAALRARHWRFYLCIGQTGHRFVCGWDTQPEDVQALLQDLKAVAS
jgi:threonine aldolase